MKEVVISTNSSLSSEIDCVLASKLLTLKGIEHYIYIEAFNEDYSTRTFKKYKGGEVVEHFYYSIYEKDRGDYFDRKDGDCDCYDDYIHLDYDTLRTDKDFIQIIKDNPKEGIKIVEIPDDVKFYIQEYEMGGEGIHECHRSWH